MINSLILSSAIFRRYLENNTCDHEGHHLCVVLVNFADLDKKMKQTVRDVFELGQVKNSRN